MKLPLLPKLLLAGALLTLFSSAAHADSKHGSSHRRPDRFDVHVSNDSDRNRNIRNERIADYQRAQSSRRDYHRGDRRYYGGGGYYRGGYYGYAPYYYSYPRTSVAIGVGTGYYDTEYIGTYRSDDDRPIYRGRQISESTSSSLEISVQRKLAKLGYYSGEIDGDIGPATRRAITRFQRDNDLAQTGRIDRNLVSALGVS
ncbi:MAG: peptidoglycan-binding domain-containing protein [Chthoniobacterales bacterium]